MFSQMAVTSRLTLGYNQKRIMRALEEDKQYTQEWLICTV